MISSLLLQDLSLIHISEPTRLLSISYAVFCLKKKRPQQKIYACGENVALRKSRVALRATSLSAAVAQNGYFDPNVAPAQQVINALVRRRTLRVGDDKG